MEQLLHGIGENVELYMNKDKDIFKFTDLPPEIRHIIYTYLLHTNLPIKITRHNPPTSNTYGPCRLKGQVYYTEGRRNGCESMGSRLKTPILYANKLINAEATKVFYSTNKFIFRGISAFHDMKHAAGDNFELLRNIDINWTQTKQTSAGTLEPLVALRNPARIVIRDCIVRRKPRPIKEVSFEVWRDLRPFILERVVYSSGGWRRPKVATRHVLSAAKQQQLLDTLFFVLPLNLPIPWKDADDVMGFKTEEEGNATFKEALSEHWRTWAPIARSS